MQGTTPDTPAGESPAGSDPVEPVTLSDDDGALASLDGEDIHEAASDGGPENLEDILGGLTLAAVDAQEELARAASKESPKAIYLTDPSVVRQESTYSRDMRDLQRCRNILEANFGSLQELIVGSIKDRQSALVASATYTVGFFDGLPLSIVRVKHLIRLTKAALAEHGIGLPQSIDDYYASL